MNHDPSPEPPQCSNHPDAPYGFDRNASHTADRYVCDCEGWTPPLPASVQSAPDRHEASRPGFEEGYEALSLGRTQIPNSIRTPYRDNVIEQRWVDWCRALDYAAQQAAPAFPPSNWTPVKQPAVASEIINEHFDKLIAAPEPAPAPGAHVAHKWDRDGERCIVCGAKDWMMGGCAPPQPAATTGAPEGETEEEWLKRVYDYPAATTGCFQKNTMSGDEEWVPDKPTTGSAGQKAREWVHRHFCGDGKLSPLILMHDDCMELADRADAAEAKLIAMQTIITRQGIDLMSLLCQQVELTHQLNAARARIAELELEPEILDRPDKPGWWWKWSDFQKNWIATSVHTSHVGVKFGHERWVRMVPPYTPKEGEG